MSKKRKHRRKPSKLRRSEPFLSYRGATSDDVTVFFEKLYATLQPGVSGVWVEDEDGFTFTADDGLSGFHVGKKL